MFEFSKNKVNTVWIFNLVSGLVRRLHLMTKVFDGRLKRFKIINQCFSISVTKTAYVAMKILTRF